MPSASDPHSRLARVASAAGLRTPENVELLESWSNDAWDCGDTFLRVCHLGDPQRLLREAAIGAALPAEVRYPPVLDAGTIDELSWMVVRRVPGTTLWERWKTMPASALRPLVSQLANALRALHGWRPPRDVHALLETHAATVPTDAQGIVGADLLPLPYPRWEPLIEAAVALPFVDGGIVRAVRERLNALESHDPFAEPSEHVIHGDINFANLLAEGDRLTAVLDFEWARLGPPDAELVSVLRACGFWRAQMPDHLPVVQWLAQDYPELFSAPDLRERVWVTEVAYMLRQLIAWPPDSEETARDEQHPLQVLPRLVEAPWTYRV